MADRFAMSVVCRESDVPKFDEKGFGEKQDDIEEGIVELFDMEATTSQIPRDVPCYGDIEGKYEIPNMIFASDGQRFVEMSGNEDMPLVHLDENGLVDPQDAKAAAEYWAVRRRAEQLMGKRAEPEKDEDDKPRDHPDHLVEVFEHTIVVHPTEGSAFRFNVPPDQIATAGASIRATITRAVANGPRASATAQKILSGIHYNGYDRTAAEALAIYMGKVPKPSPHTYLKELRLCVLIDAKDPAEADRLVKPFCNDFVDLIDKGRTDRPKEHLDIWVEGCDEAPEPAPRPEEDSE